MKYKAFLTVLLALVVTFSAQVSTVLAADSISAYMGFSREVNEALAKQIQDKLGIEVKNITLSWGEIWARVKTEYARNIFAIVLVRDRFGPMLGNESIIYRPTEHHPSGIPYKEAGGVISRCATKGDRR